VGVGVGACPAVKRARVRPLRPVRLHETCVTANKNSLQQPYKAVQCFHIQKFCSCAGISKHGTFVCHLRQSALDLCVSSPAALVRGLAGSCVPLSVGPTGSPLYDSTFSRTVWRLYGGANDLVMWYYREQLRGAAGHRQRGDVPRPCPGRKPAFLAVKRHAAHTKAPYKTDLHRRTLMVLDRPGTARTVHVALRRVRAGGRVPLAVPLVRVRADRCALEIIPHHETFRTIIQPSYSSTKG
jgi:hypothetical protein